MNDWHQWFNDQPPVDFLFFKPTNQIFVWIQDVTVPIWLLIVWGWTSHPILLFSTCLLNNDITWVSDLLQKQTCYEGVCYSVHKEIQGNIATLLISLCIIEALVALSIKLLWVLCYKHVSKGAIIPDRSTAHWKCTLWCTSMIICGSDLNKSHWCKILRFPPDGACY